MIRRSLLVVSVLLAPLAGPASAQISLKKIKEAVKKVTPADSAKAKADSAGKAKPDSAKSRPDSGSKPAAKVWENYDFVPGSKVIFYTDFSEDRVGNFARGLKYRSGEAEVEIADGVRGVRALGRAEVLLPRA